MRGECEGRGAMGERRAASKRFAQRMSRSPLPPKRGRGEKRTRLRRSHSSASMLLWVFALISPHAGFATAIAVRVGAFLERILEVSPTFGRRCWQSLTVVMTGRHGERHALERSPVPMAESADRADLSESDAAGFGPAGSLWMSL